MFNPDHFAENRTERLEDAIRTIGFAALVTHGDDGFMVTHMPFLFSPDGKGGGVLDGHMARPNDHWKLATEPVSSIAIFQGPHTYISPSWYPTKQETGKVVPTWNYAVVHVHGMLRAIDDVDWLVKHVSALTDRHEAEMPTPWATSDAPDGFTERMARGIVGVRLEISHIEGKWKMSQNRNEQDSTGAHQGLLERGRDQDRAVAREMTALKE